MTETVKEKGIERRQAENEIRKALIAYMLYFSIDNNDKVDSIIKTY